MTRVNYDEASRQGLIFKDHGNGRSDTGDLTIPNQYSSLRGSRRSKVSLLAVCRVLPMKFGKGETVIFDSGEAEYVGEGQNKSSSDFTRSVQTFEPFKFHKTVRMTMSCVGERGSPARCYSGDPRYDSACSDPCTGLWRYSRRRTRTGRYSSVRYDR